MLVFVKNIYGNGAVMGRVVLVMRVLGKFPIKNFQVLSTGEFSKSSKVFPNLMKNLSGNVPRNRPFREIDFGRYVCTPHRISVRRTVSKRFTVPSGFDALTSRVSRGYPPASKDRLQSDTFRRPARTRRHEFFERAQSLAAPQRGLPTIPPGLWVR